MYKAVLILLGFLIPQWVMGQQHHSIRWFDESDGLPTREVTDIDQDDQGNILMSTYLGLVVYDGKRVLVKTKMDGIPCSSIFNLEHDAFGRVWIRDADRKVSFLQHDTIVALEEYNRELYRTAMGVFAYFPTPDVLILDKLYPHITYRFVRSGADWRLESTTETDNLGAPIRNPVNQEQLMGYFDYIKYKEQKIAEFNLPGKKQVSIPLPEVYGRLSSLRCKDRDYFSVDEHLFEISEYGVEQVYHVGRQIIKLYNGRDNTFWASYPEGGIQQYSKATLKPIGAVLLKNLMVKSFFQDSEGGHWFCTPQGPAYMEPHPYAMFKVEEYIASRLNTGFLRDDTLWLGHSNGDIGYVLPGKQMKEHIFFRGASVQPGEAEVMMDMVSAPDGDILCSMTLSGIFRIDRHTARARKLSSWHARHFVPDKPDEWYCAAWYDGLLRIRGDSVEKLYGPKVDDWFTFTRIIKYDSALFLGSYSGLTRVEDTVVHLFSHPVLQERIATLETFRKSILAVGTFGSGMALLSAHDTLLISTREGLISNFVNAFLEDSRGNLWVLTANGVSKITFPDAADMSHYQITNMSGSQLLNYDCFEAYEHENNIYILSNDGLSVIPDGEISAITSSLPLSMLRIMVNGAAAPIEKPVVLSYSDKNRITLQYRLNTFNNHVSVKYYYRLKGAWSKWRSTENESIELEALPPGEYTLELYARKDASETRYEAIPVRIVIAPLLWQRLWFQVLCVLLLVACIAIVFQWRLRYLHRKENEKLSFQLELSELEAKAMRAQMNPHFVFNAINAIQHYVLENNPHEAYDYLSRFSRLIRLVLNNSMHKTIALHKELETLQLYIELERIRFEIPFSYHIEVSPDLEDENIQVPSMIIQPYVENAIRHGLMPKKSEAQLSIKMFEKHESLYIVIDDNGIGRAAAAQYTSSYHRSFGLSITEERLRLLQQQRNGLVKVEITDKMGEDGTACGTTVELILPLH